MRQYGDPLSLYIRALCREGKIIKGPEQNTLKPKAARKMLVSELKEELEAQGLPTDGTRNVLYQRVQKARRINSSRGLPLWVPRVEEDEEEVDEELEELISRIKFKKAIQSSGDSVSLERDLMKHINPLEEDDDLIIDALDDADSDAGDEVAEDGDDDEVDDDEEVEVEQTEIQVYDRVKDKEADASKPPQMIGVQLLKDSDQSTSSSRKLKRRFPRESMELKQDDDWFPEDIYEAFKELREYESV